MTVLRSILLDIARSTPFMDLAQSRFLEGHLQRMLQIGFTASPALDPLSDPPLHWLQWMCDAAAQTNEDPQHGVVLALRALIKPGATYNADLHLQRINGVGASAGKTCMALDSLADTIYLIGDEGFGPLSIEEMARLREAVYREFPARGGVFDVDQQVWDDTYIARNVGASRRFALWRRLNRTKPAYIQARVTPYDLDADALHVLRSQWRLIWASGQGMIVPFMDARDVIPNSFYSFGKSYGGVLWDPLSDPQFWAVPYTHCMPPQLSGLMDALHRHIDESGALDIGRYLTERISAAKRRQVQEP